MLAILMAPVLMQAAAGQDENCTPQFAIYSAESVDGAPATFVIIHIAVKNTGSCAGTLTVSAQHPENWLASTFTTGVIQPGDVDTTQFIKVIMPSDAVTSVINFTAPGANGSSTTVIIAGSSQKEPGQQNQTPVINVIPNPAINTSAIKPQETQPQQQAEPQTQNQPASSVTGLLTANPSVQITIFAILLFGAGYTFARMKTEGFRYRFKRK
jgi:hypothetical protein